MLWATCSDSRIPIRQGLPNEEEGNGKLPVLTYCRLT